MEGGCKGLILEKLLNWCCHGKYWTKDREGGGVLDIFNN